MLTDLACRRAAKKEKPYKLSDGRGLFLYVTPTGYKSWRWKYRIGGKEKLVVFGPYPDIGLTEARNLRDTTARDLRAGVDPAIDKRQKAAAQTARMGNTFELFALEWHASQVPTWSKRHAALVLSSMKADVFPKIGRMPIDTITTPLVLEVLRPIEQRGAIETAHRVRQRISEVFSRAIGAGVVASDPSAVTVKALGRATKRKNPAVRTIVEARDVLRRVEAQPGHPLTKLGSRFLALTSVRMGVLRYAEPHEFEDLDGSTPIWRIPAAKMKLGVERKEDVTFEFLVPLSRQAVETVKVAMAFAHTSPLIFHSPRHPRRAMSDSTVSKAYRMAGFAGVHVPHGWRASFSTIMNELASAERSKADREILDLMLAHIPTGVSSNELDYNRAAYMPRRRELAQRWADLLTDGLESPTALLNTPRR